MSDTSQGPLPPRSAYAGILLCSVGVLMQEILLTRIFSLTIWYHLAYLTISTALLGFAAAGTLLASRPALLERGAERIAAAASAGAGLTLPIALWLLAPHPLDPQNFFSEPGPLFLGLLGYYVCIALPFFLAGVAIAAPLAAYPARVNRLYASDLLGAGLGCAAAVASLSWLDAAAAVIVCAAIFLAAAACYAPGQATRVALVVAALLVVVASPAADRVIDFLPSESKSLGSALRDSRMVPLFRRWSPINRVDVFRFQPLARGAFWGTMGLSKDYRGPKPRALSLVYDGHNGSDIFEWRDPSSLQMLDHHILRTPYLLTERPRVLVIGVGGGVDVLNAVRRGAAHVTGVDLQPITIALHNGLLAKFTGGVFQRPEVELVGAEGRHYVRAARENVDLIQITMVDTFSAQTTGAYVLAESYLYTVEAFHDYLARLDDDGLVSVTLGDIVAHDLSGPPPPLLGRLAMVARTALESGGVAEPWRHIVALAHVRPAETVVTSATESLIVKKTPFSNDQLARVAAFAAEKGFHMIVAPDRSDSALARLVHAPRDDLDALLEEEPYLLGPVSDDRPFFFNVVPWSSLIRGADIFWMVPGSATGLGVLAMMLAQALLLGSVLILAPLVRLGTGALPARDTVRFLFYFLGLGLGFLLIEISFVQKYVLLLGYPTYSLSVTIFSLLLFAAVGAYLSSRFWHRPRRLLLRLLVSTALLVVLEVSLLPWIRDASLAAPLGVRIAITFGLQLPLGVTLGMYFPTGLDLLRRREPRLIPWAWAVNGVASVAATVLAVILGLQFGFSAVALIAVAVYAVGTLSLITILPRDA